ncbi:beta-glucosidase J [Aspergillus venezuelensis]
MANIDVETTLKKLSLDEKVALLSGTDFWHTASVPDHGIPSIHISDGPNGIRGTKVFNDVPAACFPCGTALAATFNQELLHEAGQLMGQEANAKKWFESLGENPVLSGLSAAAIIRGIQSTGVQATVKHFICNEQEHKRNGVQSIVTERALREIYALPFQIAASGCREGLVMSDWCGLYSTVEAIKAGLDSEMPGPSLCRGSLLKFAAETGKLWPHILDECTAIPGLVEGGPEENNDTLETGTLLRRIANESIVLLKNDRGLLPLSKDRETLVIGPNAKVTTYCGGGSAALEPYYAVSPYDGIKEKLAHPPAYTVGAYTHKLFPLLGAQMQTRPVNGKPGMIWKVYNEPPGTGSRKAIEELWLTNTNIDLNDYKHPASQALWYADLEGTLIVDEDGKYEFGLAVCGTAKLYIDEELVVDNSTEQKLGDTFYGLGTMEERGQVALFSGKAYHIKVDFSSAPSYTLKVDNAMLGGGGLRVGCCKVIDAQQEIQKAVELAGIYDQVIICGGLNGDWEQESSDRTNMKLPGVLDQLISKVTIANPRTVVVMQTGTPVEMPWLDTMSALVQAWYGGNETGNCIADVLSGDYNRSGKLPVTFPNRLQDVPLFLNFRTEAGRKLYGEDVYVGYRYYELEDLEVNFPFGHGLSYTSFSFSDLNLENTGLVKGAEVTQLPVKESKGFAKVELDPGECKEVTISVAEKYAASYFDEERDQWCVETGHYRVFISDSGVLTDGNTGVRWLHHLPVLEVPD